MITQAQIIESFIDVKMPALIVSKNEPEANIDYVP